MELHQALKHVIKAEGQDIVTDIRLINILNDLQAYQDIQGSKYILRAIIDDGIARRFMQIGSFNNQAQDLIRKFIVTTGFNDGSVLKIFYSLAFGLGWINQMPTPSSSQPSPAPHPQPTPNPKPQPQPNSSSHLNLTESQLDNKSESFKHRYAKDAEKYLDSIIKIYGNAEADLGVTLNVKISFVPECNTFDVNLEFRGGFKVNTDYVTFDVVMKSTAGKVMAHQQAFIDRQTGHRPYFVESVYMAREDFKRVSDIAEIIIYWKKE